MKDEALSRTRLTEVARAIAKRKVSSEEVVRNSLGQLEKYGSSLNCLVRLFTENVLEAAKKADQELASGNSRGRIHGVPPTHKDMFYRAGQITACGSKICESYFPNNTATVLLNHEQEGALDLCRLNMV